MPTDLTPGEKDEREIERLRDDDPPPSRKYREERAPRPWQKRRRMKVEDSDIKPPSEVASPALYDERLLNRLLKDAEGFYDDMDPEELAAIMDEADSEDELQAMLDEASYGRSSTMHKTGAYHGVVDQRGNPTNPPNTEYRSYDKRYFTDKDFKEIVARAKELLKDDWFAYGWDGGSKDAPVRAALDISIQTLRGSLYQSKIDSETYEMLLNRLAGWGYDSFSETVLPMKKQDTNNRKAAMNKSPAYQALVRLASSLRQTDPAAALTVMKNLRSLVSTEAVAESISDVAAEGGDDDSCPCPDGGPDMTASPTPPPPEEAPEAPEAPEDQTAAGEDPLFDPGESLDAKAFDDMKQKGNKLKEMAEKGELSQQDVLDFVADLDAVFEGIQMTASMELVPLPILIRMAASDENAKRVLGPLLLAARKKRSKSKKKPAPSASKKKSGGKGNGKDKDENENPFGGKKAPPFGKGKGKGKKKGKKKKASFTPDDLAW